MVFSVTWCARETYFPTGIAFFLAQMAAQPKPLTELMLQLWEHALWEYECFCSPEGQAIAKRAKKEPTTSTCLLNIKETRTGGQTFGQTRSKMGQRNNTFGHNAANMMNEKR